MYVRLSKTQLAFIIPAALYILWLSCIDWLNTFWLLVHMGRSLAPLLHVLFFLTHAAAIIAFALWLDRFPSVQRLKISAAVSAILTAGLTGAMIFVPTAWLIVCALLSAISSGFFAAYLIFFAFLKVPAEKHGITLGIASALGVAVHLIGFQIWPEQAGSVLVIKTSFAVLVMLILGGVMLLLPVCRDRLWHERTPTKIKANVAAKRKPYILILICLILLCFFISFGMQDLIISGIWQNGNLFLGFTRIFLVAGFIAAGIIWDTSNRYLLLSSSFGLLAMGFIGMAYYYKGPAGLLGISCLQMAQAFILVAARAVFLQIANYFKRPALVCSLGMALPLIFKEAGIVSAYFLHIAHHDIVIFLISFIAIVVALPLISLSLERMRNLFMLHIRQSSPVLDMAYAAEIACASGNSNTDTPEIRPLQASTAIAGINEDNNEAIHRGEGWRKTVAVPVAWPDMLEDFARRYGLTNRESQVLELTLHGLSISEMAQNLSIAEPTVKQYIGQMLRKTEMKNRRQLLSFLITELNTAIDSENQEKPPY